MFQLLYLNTESDNVFRNISYTNVHAYNNHGNRLDNSKLAIMYIYFTFMYNIISHIQGSDSC